MSLVGHIPSSLLLSALPTSPGLIELALPAFLIALIGFIESVSVGKTLGAKRRQRIDPDQELIGLGAANTACHIGRVPRHRRLFAISRQDAGLKPKWHQCWPHSALRWQRYCSPTTLFSA